LKYVQTIEECFHGIAALIPCLLYLSYKRLGCQLLLWIAGTPPQFIKASLGALNVVNCRLSCTVYVPPELFTITGCSNLLCQPLQCLGWTKSNSSPDGAYILPLTESLDLLCITGYLLLNTRELIYGQTTPPVLDNNT
jgi:hypothetical protein